MKLLHLPDQLIDYILLHELVHTRVKNHSQDFWNELETVVPNARTVDKQLKISILFILTSKILEELTGQKLLFPQ